MWPFFYFPKAVLAFLSLSLSLSSPTLRVFDFVRFLSISFRFQKKDVFLCTNVCDVFVSKQKIPRQKSPLRLALSFFKNGWNLVIEGQLCEKDQKWS